MVRYQCCEDGKPCGLFEIKTWDEDTFNNKRVAEIFCYFWANPINLEDAIKNAPEMPLNEGVMMGMGPTKMSIREVDVESSIPNSSWENFVLGTIELLGLNGTAA